jgi:hypothetical protein
MRKGKPKRRKAGGPPARPDPETALAEARQHALALAEDGAEAAIWGRLNKALLAAGAAGRDVMPLIIARNLEGVHRMIGVLSGDEPAGLTPEAAPEASPAPEAVPDDVKRHAMKAFRRRLKLTRLDHESRLGVGPLTGGKAAEFESILPPRDFGPEVWKALAADGQLEATGRGFYKLP